MSGQILTVFYKWAQQIIIISTQSISNDARVTTYKTLLYDCPSNQYAIPYM